MAEGLRKALILPGAGARGAYQVGVLKAIARLLPRHARNPFAVIAGTSAGAINAAVLASRASNFNVAVGEMERVWANFEAEQVYRADNWTMLKSSLHWLVALVFGGLGVRNPEFLLDNSPLRGLLERNIDFEHIQRAIDRGYLDALAVTASAYTSSRSVTFFQGAEGLQPWARVRRVGRAERIGVEHLMASAAVPFVFSPVKIGGEYYGDGAMRQRAPLSPAVHLGADRILVIGVRDERPDQEPTDDTVGEMPTLAHLAGYMLDTLFMDGLYADLERISRINAIIEQAPKESLTGPVSKLRVLETLVIVPEEDLRDVAERHVRELPRAIRLLLGGLGARNRGGQQLISYLLFESGYTRELIDMGYRDGMAMEEDLRAFLYDQPTDTLDARFDIKQDLLFEIP
ncbi:MAG: patatin-like phospholipase family protein [Gammaproteobacteria bacterium]|nr:patatin-like phospholipase family protein [Gammaproteobacteria bacterium]MDH3506463.1 patatin-like phospholipase family protein [Gammaproteobacteria bacterium]